MRIIGGKFRGRKINHPGGANVRPTKDRVREAVFNIIAEKVPGSCILDIFAGSGAYGLEALSRGALKALFIEKDKKCSKVIMENAQKLGIATVPIFRVITSDTFKALKMLVKERERFDLVFLDPPYNMGLGKKTLIVISQCDILTPTGLVIVEHAKFEEMSPTEGNFSMLKQRSYGDTCISIYRKDSAD